MKLTKKTSIHYKGKVVDLTVQNSHTYNVERISVHNSGAGSLINYILDITDLDPIEWDLPFGRFLSIYRVGLPDVDTDVSDRDKILDVMREQFGNTNVVPISNYNTTKLKSLTKDISI
jgi:DNA polymerase-3 subunit alpha